MNEPGFSPAGAEQFQAEPQTYINYEHPAIKELGDALQFHANQVDQSMLHRVYGEELPALSTDHPGYRSILMRREVPVTDDSYLMVQLTGASGNAEGTLAAASMMQMDQNLTQVIGIDSARTVYNKEEPFIKDPTERAYYEAALVIDQLKKLPPEQIPPHLVLAGGSLGALDAIYMYKTLKEQLKRHNIPTEISMLLLSNVGGIYDQSNFPFWKSALDVPKVVEEITHAFPTRMDMLRKEREIQRALHDPDKTKAVRLQRELDEMKRADMSQMYVLKREELELAGITGKKQEKKMEEFAREYQLLDRKISSLSIRFEEPLSALSKWDTFRLGRLEAQRRKLLVSLVGNRMLNRADNTPEILSNVEFAKLGLDITIPPGGLTKEAPDNVRAAIDVPIALQFVDINQYFAYKSAMKKIRAAQTDRAVAAHARGSDWTRAIQEGLLFPNAPVVLIARRHGAHQTAGVESEKSSVIAVKLQERTKEAMQQYERQRARVAPRLTEIARHGERIRMFAPELSEADAEKQARQEYIHRRASMIQATRGPRIGREEALSRAAAELVVPQVQVTLNY